MGAPPISRRWLARCTAALGLVMVVAILFGMMVRISTLPVRVASDLNMEGAYMGVDTTRLSMLMGEKLGRAAVFSEVCAMGFLNTAIHDAISV